MPKMHDEQVEQWGDEERAEVLAGSRPVAGPRERPILFSGPMVRAILEDRKIQTRRVIKPQPAFTPAQEREIISAFPGSTLGQCMTQAWLDGWVDVTCPYGQPGDRLWVRETYRVEQGGRVPSGHKAVELSYSADGARRWLYDDAKSEEYPLSPSRWSRTFPSIHMPRWASRLTLEVTEVRVQRLQEISEEDARAEGVEPLRDEAGTDTGEWLCYHCGGNKIRARGSFETLWDSINGERPGCSWEANPFVWAISFRRLP